MLPAGSSGSPDFGARAGRYDALRPQDDAWWARLDALVREGDLRGRRVLDVGCGTGSLVAALVESAQAKVWGVDPSEEMLAVARNRLPRGVGLQRAHAEHLPFRDGWFERVVYSLVVHLVDRPQAFAEAARVLEASGRIALATFTQGHFDTYWLTPWFPRIAEIDRERFPTPVELDHELGEAGFAAPRHSTVATELVIDRETALERLRGRHISTFDLLDEDELRDGIARAERELPEQVHSRLEQLIVVADRAA